MKVAVIGIGLIGGSLALTLKENGEASQIIGVDKDPGNGVLSLEKGIVDQMEDLEEALSKVDLIILSTPVNAMVELLGKILDQIKDHQVVMDVGSTKTELLAGIKRHPNRGRYVATHPMAGTEFSGPQHAFHGLFHDKYTVICDAMDSDKDALETVVKIYRAIPMKILYLGAVEHDVHAAYVSHISHISSFALALTVLAKEADENRIFELAGSGFGSTVRLAKSSAEMWVPIFEQNRDNVLDVLDEHINQLAAFRSLLIKRDFKTMYEKIKKANTIRAILEQKGLD
jgi:prephenate dehydrogenase